MNDQTRALVENQVRRVRRRLFGQIVLQSLLLGWAVGFLATMLWFLLRPFTFAGLGETVRWSVPGFFLSVSTLAGLLLAWLRRPNLVVSSLALDEKFGLHERVTTLLTLPADQLRSPAGQALLKDVVAHLTTLEVSSQFPVTLSLKHALVPAGALMLAAVACLFDPLLSNLKFGSRTLADQPRPAIDVQEIQQQMDNLKKVVSQRNLEQETKSEQLKELEKEFEKLINQPVDPKNDEKVREQIGKMRKLEDRMKERLEGLKEQTEKIDILKKQLEKLGLDKDAKLKDGPAKDFEDALMKGQFNKAKDILEKLVKDLKNDKLSTDKQKELADQFKRASRQTETPGGQ